MAQGRTRSKGKLGNVGSTASLIQDSGTIINRAEALYDEIEADAALSEELARCCDIVATLPEDDPRYIAATERVDFLTGPAYRRQVRRELAVKRLGRWVRQTVFVAVMLVLRPFLVVVFNIVGFFLFIFLVLWLISL